ncbi:MAG: cytochrome d ubiquinol oxidase subunit II, partial [Syntrophomonadaceae bacterium]
MATLFFCFLAFMLAAYAVLDGYDLGTGALHLRLAADDAERRQLLRTIGPLWDGNEVFLVAAGGTLFFAFPTLYAASFSGFYLPLILVLWLLVLRGISIDLRSHLDSPLWRTFFDVVFSASSTLLAFFLGVALGNVVRGVPIGPDTAFFQPLWDFGRDPGILDGYTVLVGATALATLALQGAAWATYRTTGAVHDRARRHVRPLWIA